MKEKTKRPAYSGEVFFNFKTKNKMENEKKYGWFDGWIDSGLIIAGIFAAKRLLQALFKEGE